MKDIAFFLLDIQELVCLYFNFLSLIVMYSSQFTWQGHRKLQWAKSKDEPLLSNCPLETAEPSRELRARTWIKDKIQEKDKKKTRKEKKNERHRNQYARVRCYKITSTLGLLVRGDPQNEGLQGLQPRALGSKLDYFHVGITSTRLHRKLVIGFLHQRRRKVRFIFGVHVVERNTVKLGYYIASREMKKGTY